MGRLATLDKNGYPTVVPFCFVFHNDAIFSIIDEKPKRQDIRKLARIRNIEQDPRVGIVVDQYSENWKKLRFIQLKGNAEILSSGAEYDGVLHLLKHKYPQYQKMNLSGRPVIRITINRVFSWSWQRKTGR